jgi:anaerobic magnesium-protoporphyrin IX monomethyl ester cyclase
MRVLFINGVLGGDFSAMDISITQLATYLNANTLHQARILDMVFHRHEWKKHLEKGMRKFRPDIIGMSCNTMYMQYTKEIIRELRKYNVAVILGGYHVSLSPDSCISIPGVSAICTGDGEKPLSEYLDRLARGKTINGLKGIWGLEDGKLIKNPRGCFTQDLDSYPTPDWDLWEDLRKYFYYLGMLYIIGSRGCPYKCIYCDAHEISGALDGKYYRIRDPRKYAQEIAFQWEKYHDKGMRLAQLFDQVPTVDSKWLKEFCDEYRKHGHAHDRKFSMFSRVDHLDEDKVRLLSQSGCALLRMGVEAGNDHIRNEVYKKGLATTKIKEIFALCHKYKIGITAYYMLGGPGENKKTIKQTIDLASKLRASRSAFFVFKPFTKESEVLIRKYGGVIDQKKWRKADNITFDAVVRLKDITPFEVEMLQYQAYSRTLPKRMWWMLASNPFKYFSRFATYMSRGINDGLDMNYLIPYFHIYAYDYALK